MIDFIQSEFSRQDGSRQPDRALKIVARGERSDGKDLALDVADSGSAS